MAGDNNTRIDIALTLLLGAAATLSACHKDPAANEPKQAAGQTHAAAPVVARKGPTAAELTAGMVEAAVQGKSQAPVALKFELLQHPKVGQAVDINLALLSHADAGPVVIKVSSADAVTIDPDSNEFDIPQIAAGEVFKSKLTVTPTGEGVMLIGVTVSVKHEELTDLKVFFIPIIADR